MSVARHSSLPLYDALHGGEIKQRLIAWRDEDPKVSYDEIAFRLRDHYGIVVSSETARRWELAIRAESDQAAS